MTSLEWKNIKMFKYQNKKLLQYYPHKTIYLYNSNTMFKTIFFIKTQRLTYNSFIIKACIAGKVSSFLSK